MAVRLDGGGALPQAAPIYPDKLYRLVQTERFSNELICQNTFFFGIQGTAGDSNGLIVDWRDNIVPAWKPNVCSNITFVEAHCQQIMPIQDAVAGVTLTGTGTGPATVCLPSPAAGVITWRTQLVGRSRRGRTYVAGLEWTSGVTADFVHWNALGLTHLSNIANAIYTRYQLGGNPDGFFLVVNSRKILSGLPPESWAQSCSMVTRYTAQSYVCTMGSRRGEHGL